MIGPKRVATSTTSLQWARYHRGQSSSSGYSTPQRPSAWLPNSVCAVPHAETSAAGAARYQCLQGSSGSSQALRRHFSTTSYHNERFRMRKGKNPVNSYAPPDGEVLRRRDEELEAAELPLNAERAFAFDPHGGDIGWTTPEEMSFSAAVERGESPRPHEELERELIAKSRLSHRLSLAFDFLEDASMRFKDSDISPEERASLVRVVHSTRASLQSLLPRKHQRKLGDVDFEAFNVVLASVIRISMDTRMRDAEIMQMLHQAPDSLAAFAPREFHRFVAEAGKARRYHLVEALFEESLHLWGGATDEWMLYAQARALGERGELHQLRGYWRVYSRYRPLPSQAQHTGQKELGSSRALPQLRPPFYLFRYLLQAQLYSSSSQARCPSNILTILRVMHAHQYEMDDTMWMLVLKASPRLRIHLPRLLIARAAKQAGAPSDGRSRQAQRLLLDMLEDRARKVVVRDVLLLLRVMQLAHRGIPPDQDSSSATFLSREELSEAHAIAARFFGRVGHPERAHRHFLQCYNALLGDISCLRCHQAAQGVIQAYTNADRPRDAIEYGLALMNSSSASPLLLSPRDGAQAGEQPTLQASSTLIGTLLQACAHIDPLSEVLPQARLVLDAMLASKVRYNKAVQTGLGTLFYAPQHQGYRRLDRMGLMVSELVGLFKSSSRRRRSVSASSPPRSMLPPRARLRLRWLLGALRSLGFEESIQLRSHNPRKVKIRRLTTRIDRLESDAEVVRTEVAGLAWMHDEEGQLRPSAVAKASSHTDVDIVSDPLAGGEAPHVGASAPANDDFDDAHITRLEEIQRRREEAERERENIAEVGSRPTMFAALSKDLRKDLDRKMSSAAFAMRLRVYAVLRRDHDAAAYIYQRMLQHGVSPTMLHVAPLIEGLALDGRIDEARAMAQSARWELGVLTTARIQTALLRGLITVGRKDEAVREFEHWRKAGGRPDGTMWGLFDDERYPRLAVESNLSFAVAEAQRGGSPLSIPEVDDAYRFLMRNRRPLAAQRLLLTAIEQTGFQPDADLRDAVRRAGNMIRKRYARQRLREEPGGGDDAQRPAHSTTTMSSRPNGRFNPEDTLSQLREAHSLQKRALQHSLAVSSGAAAADEACAAFVRDLRELVLDWISGVWSPVDSEETKARNRAIVSGQTLLWFEARRTRRMHGVSARAGNGPGAGTGPRPRLRA